MSATLRFDNIGKVFPGVRALDGVSFDVHVGEVHGLMGENGAGKSTLLKILGGEYQPDSGRVLIDGNEVHFPSAAASIAAGIAVIHQELQYVPDLTRGRKPAARPLAEHVRLGEQARSQKHRDANACVAMGVDLDPNAKLRQPLDRAAADGRNLQGAAAQCARDRTRRTDQFAVAPRDRSAVQARARPAGGQPRADLHLAPHGRDLRAVRHLHDFPRWPQDRVASEARRRAARRRSSRKWSAAKSATSYDYKPRELGRCAFRVAKRRRARAHRTGELRSAARRDRRLLRSGGRGAQRTDAPRSTARTARRPATITLDGKPIKVRSAGEAIRHGIVLCPEDRKEEGIDRDGDGRRRTSTSACRRHYLRAGLFLDRKKEAQTAERFIKLLKIKTPSRRQKIRFLSGGNQQKAILSRWLAEPDLKVVILDEPTRGIDVGAKHEIYNVIYQLAERGCAIVMISSELPEVLGVSDRIVVMRQGRIAGRTAARQGERTSRCSVSRCRSRTRRASSLNRLSRLNGTQGNTERIMEARENLVSQASESVANALIPQNSDKQKWWQQVTEYSLIVIFVVMFITMSADRRSLLLDREHARPRAVDLADRHGRVHDDVLPRLA